VTFWRGGCLFSFSLIPGADCDVDCQGKFIGFVHLVGKTGRPNVPTFRKSL